MAPIFRMHPISAQNRLHWTAIRAYLKLASPGQDARGTNLTPTAIVHAHYLGLKPC